MEGPVEVANFRTKLEAEIAGGLLEGAEIPYIIQSTEGILHGPIGPGATILVSESLADHARALLGKAVEAPPEDAA
ncbi:MAG: DUF2007 domain-containing protein [Gemmatimonadetes bacterium]|nr:DUF2007 domain-containing protein [Gemmatimonadota bacterium]